MPMYRALYNYGISHPDVVKPQGVKERKVHYIVELDAAGRFIEMRKPESNKTLCPDLGSSTSGSGTKANVLMEKASISIMLDPEISEAQMARVKGKRECFLRYFEESKIPAFEIVSSALTDSRELDAIQSAAQNLKVTCDNVIGFSVDGKLLSDMPETYIWWAEIIRKRAGGEPTQPDIVTGLPCVPMKTVKVLSSDNPLAFGGKSTGVMLMSFNSPSSEHHGQKQCQNAPMDAGTMNTIVDAAEAIGKTAIIVGPAKIAHWYEGDVTGSDDVLQSAFFGFD